MEQMAELSLSCNASSLVAARNTPSRLRCCFSEQPLGPCVLVQDATVHGDCAFPTNHPHDGWYLRTPDVAAPSLRVFRNGTVVYFSAALSQAQHQLRTCSGSFEVPESAPPFTTDAALVVAFAAGCLLSASVAMFARMLCKARRPSRALSLDDAERQL